MARVNLNKLRFVKITRNSSSETFLLWSGPIRLGHLSVQFGSTASHAILIIEAKATENLIDRLSDEIYSFYGDPETTKESDFILTIFSGKEVGFCSGRYDHSDAPATSRDLQVLNQHLVKHTGKHQRILGQLNESMVREYFEHFHYTVRKATAKEDALKVDLIAERGGVDVLIQVKTGEFSNRSIRDCIKTVVESNRDASRGYLIALVARSFPVDFPLKRIDMETEFECRLICINLDEIVRILPQYRHSLS